MAEKYELIELFESEPHIIDEEAGLYEYKREDKYGFTLKMSLFVYDQYCCLILQHKDLQYPLIEISFRNVGGITCRKDKLFVHQAHGGQDFVVYFKPSYTLRFEDKINQT